MKLDDYIFDFTIKTVVHQVLVQKLGEIYKNEFYFNGLISYSHFFSLIIKSKTIDDLKIYLEEDTVILDYFDLDFDKMDSIIHVAEDNVYINAEEYISRNDTIKDLLQDIHNDMFNKMPMYTM